MLGSLMKRPEGVPPPAPKPAFDPMSTQKLPAGADRTQKIPSGADQRTAWACESCAEC